MRSSPFFIVATALLALCTTPAQAYCGKQCKEARSFCNQWEKKHPGEECGRVRGAICNAPGSGGTWKKIEQVNAFWATCHLVKGEDDLHAAQRRCEKVEDNEGHECEVHSPRCNAGWTALGDYGKFQSCRQLEASGSLIYDGYKQWMRKWEGKADTPLPPLLAAFVRRHYAPLDASKVRFGFVSDVKGATCITDCTHIYCDSKSAVGDVGSGAVSAGHANLIFHELSHAQECAKVGSREAYAKNWFKSQSAGFIRALAAHEEHEFKRDIHDLMPTEMAAETKGAAMAKLYADQWWNQLAHCRIYKADRKTVVYTMADRHTRTACTPGGNAEIGARLQEALQQAAKQHGGGTYWLAHGRADQGEPKGPGDDSAGFWIEVKELAGAPQRSKP